MYRYVCVADRYRSKPTLMEQFPKNWSPCQYDVLNRFVTIAQRGDLSNKSKSFTMSFIKIHFHTLLSLHTKQNCTNSVNKQIHFKEFFFQNPCSPFPAPQKLPRSCVKGIMDELVGWLGPNFARIKPKPAMFQSLDCLWKYLCLRQLLTESWNWF